MQSELVRLSLTEQSRLLSSGACSSVELTRAYLAQIERREPSVGAYLLVDREGALQAAERSDQRRRSGNTIGVLDGIPYAVKDNFCTQGLKTTGASRMLEHFVPPHDATVVARLKNSGAILLGKLNMDEFAMGSSGEMSALGTTKNPLDSHYVAGGSSSGSAAAVAAEEASFSLGSDTGGSIRQPAAFCGVLGLRPTYGVLSRYGMIAMASSLDCVGIVGRSASDLATVFGNLIGKDALDATSRSYSAEQFLLGEKRKLLRVAIVEELTSSETVSADAVRACKRAAELLSANGAEIASVSLPSPELALASYCVLSATEAASNMGRLDGVRFGVRATNQRDLESLYENTRTCYLGEEVKRRILFGSYMLTRGKREQYYDTARAARDEIRAAMQSLLSRYDLIINPTTPNGARRCGEVRTPLEQRREDLCAVYASLAGLPAVSVPFEHDERGMPLGIHLTAAPFCERLLLETAQLFEEVE